VTLGFGKVLPPLAEDDPFAIGYMDQIRNHAEQVLQDAADVSGRTVLVVLFDPVVEVQTVWLPRGFVVTGLDHPFQGHDERVAVRLITSTALAGLSITQGGAYPGCRDPSPRPPRSRARRDHTPGGAQVSFTGRSNGLTLLRSRVRIS
jgi:hypothetical protein